MAALRQLCRARMKERSQCLCHLPTKRLISLRKSRWLMRWYSRQWPKHRTRGPFTRTLNPMRTSTTPSPRSIMMKRVPLLIGLKAWHSTGSLTVQNLREILIWEASNQSSNKKVQIKSVRPWSRQMKTVLKTLILADRSGFHRSHRKRSRAWDRTLKNCLEKIRIYCSRSSWSIHLETSLKMKISWMISDKHRSALTIKLLTLFIGASILNRRLSVWFGYQDNYVTVFLS